MSPHTPARRYLVTGGRGFIGRHLLARLVAQGAEVHATTRSATPPADPHVRWWRVDLADAVATEELVTRLRPDVVVHLAARADGTRRLDAVVPILTDTLLSTVSVLAAAARLPECKVVLAGSVEDGGHQLHVGAGEDREADAVHVLGHGGGDDLLGRQPDALVDDLEAGVACPDRHLLGAVGVPVEAGLAHQQPQPPAELLAGLSHPLADRG